LVSFELIELNLSESGASLFLLVLAQLKVYVVGCYFHLEFTMITGIVCPTRLFLPFTTSKLGAVIQEGQTLAPNNPRFATNKVLLS